MRALNVSILAALSLLLAACAPVPPAALAPAAPAATTPAAAASTATEPAATAPAAAAPAPLAVPYNLGDAVIVQARFPEDSRFRNMPVRLDGVIATPPQGEGPFPVVVILHGTHPGCPEIDHVDRWPCDLADERQNYRGFAYLAETLAAHGYVALSININAENTFGFGEPTPGERLTQIVDRHLAALAAASAGGENKFGVDLKGKAAMHRLAFAGHSRGADLAYMLSHDESFAGAGAPYGPIAGILMIAASPGFMDPAAGSPVPLALVLPMCDGDVSDQQGQHFYEGARLAAGQQAWVTSAFLEAANHNAFNRSLGADPFVLNHRPECAAQLDPAAQQAWLSDYAVDFFAALFGGAEAGDAGAGDAAAVQAAKARLGMDMRTLAPSELYGKAARVAVLPGAAVRTPLFTPAAACELKTNRLGGAVTAAGVTTLFCEAGHYTPSIRPGTEPCRRTTAVVPGQPSLAVVSWEQPGGVLRFEVPQGKGDLSRAAAISLRAGVDPLSKLNPVGQAQAFSIRVTDGAGKTATATTRPDEPALWYPPGEVLTDGTPGALFTGLVPLTTVRAPLSALEGVDLSDIREIALVFDRTPAGSLFLGDLEWATAGGPRGAAMMGGSGA